MLARLLNWICPLVKFGETLPYGFSRGRPSSGPDTERFRLHLPLFWWKGVDYYAAWDCERDGWWLQTFMVGVQRVPGGYDIQLRTGAWPRGNGLIKMWRGQKDHTLWITEEDWRKSWAR